MAEEINQSQDMDVVQEQQQPQQPVLPFVGGYVITGKGRMENALVFRFLSKPNRIHRFFCKVLLGWIWVDNQNEIK